MNTGVHVYFQPLDKCPRVGLLDHMVVLFLVFQGTSVLFSIEAIPIYIPTNSVGGFPFLHTLSSIHSLQIKATLFHSVDQDQLILPRRRHPLLTCSSMSIKSPKCSGVSSILWCDGILAELHGKSALSLMNRDSSLAKVGIMRMKSTKCSSGALESLKVEPFLLSPFRSKDLYKLSIGDTVPKRGMAFSLQVASEPGASHSADHFNILSDQEIWVDTGVI